MIENKDEAGRNYAEVKYMQEVCFFITQGW